MGYGPSCWRTVHVFCVDCDAARHDMTCAPVVATEGRIRRHSKRRCGGKRWRQWRRHRRQSQYSQRVKEIRREDAAHTRSPILSSNERSIAQRNGVVLIDSACRANAGAASVGGLHSFEFLQNSSNLFQFLFKFLCESLRTSPNRSESLQSIELLLPALSPRPGRKCKQTAASAVAGATHAAARAASLSLRAPMSCAVCTACGPNL